MSNGKGSTPRPLSVTPSTYAANYARIQWTETPKPQHDLDAAKALQQANLDHAKRVILGTPCSDPLPPETN